MTFINGLDGLRRIGKMRQCDVRMDHKVQGSVLCLNGRVTVTREPAKWPSPLRFLIPELTSRSTGSSRSRSETLTNSKLLWMGSTYELHGMRKAQIST